MKEPPRDTNLILNEILGELSSGLVYAHTRLDDNANRAINNAAKLAALIDLLREKGLLAAGEVEERSKQILLDLVIAFSERGLGAEYLDSKYDAHDPKDDAIIGCSDRVSLCKAVCCRLPFPLTRNEVETGTIRWEFARPYFIAKGVDGYCVHFDREAGGCTVYERRPVSCRLFDCRTDSRWPVWEDWERRAVNTGLIERLTALPKPGV